MNFFAVRHLPLTVTSAIFFTMPLMVCALSLPLLGEKVGARRWAAIAVGLCDVLLVTRPWGASFHLAVLLSAGATLGASRYALATRKLAGGDSAATQQAFAALVGDRRARSPRRARPCDRLQVPVHSAPVGQAVTVHYPWRPFHGQTLRSYQRVTRPDREVVHVEAPYGRVLLIPAWMLDTVACSALRPMGSPMVDGAALAELRTTLCVLGFGRDCPEHPLQPEIAHADGQTAHVASPGDTIEPAPRAPCDGRPERQRTARGDRDARGAASRGFPARKISTVVAVSRAHSCWRSNSCGTE